MEYNKTVILKNSKSCVIRNCEKDDASQVFSVFNLTHEQTDFLLTYPDENSFIEEQEAEFLLKKKESEREVELCAVVDGKIVATAGVEEISPKYKVRHRAEFGISVEKSSWGNGIGYALTLACVECAKKAGYSQLELSVVADNAAAVALYKKIGFKEFGRNPKGFKSRVSSWQEIVLMRLELD